MGVMEDVKYFQCIERSMTIGITNQKVYKDTGTLYRDKNKKLILKSQEIGSLLN